MYETRKIAEGKTKIIYSDFSVVDQLVIENKDTVTAGDGARSDIIPGKGRMATQTASNVFRLLASHGVESHFIDQVSPKRFRAQKLYMIPLEVVARRNAYGSYVRRHPETTPGQRMGSLAVEFFAKDDELHDPLVEHDYNVGVVRRFDAHQPIRDAEPIDSYPIAINTSRFGLSQRDREYITSQTAESFEIIEDAWAKQGYTLIDMKLEFGRNLEGRILLGDAVDNDQWRLWRQGDPEQMVDKQLYRDGRPLEEVAAAYAEVAEASQNF